LKKLVILSSRFPYPLEKGDKLRLFHQIKYLQKHFDIYLFSIVESNLLQGSAREVTKYCKGFKYYKISRPRQAIGLALNLFSKLPYQVRYFYDKKIKEQIETEIELLKPDLIYCQLVRMGPYTTHLNYPMVIDYMDAFSLIMKRRYQNAESFYRRWFYKLEARRLKKYENKIQSRFSKKTIISKQDKQALHSVSDLTVISNGVDINYYQPKEIAKSYDILFAGNMGYAPNVAGVKYLVNKILNGEKYSLLIAGARPIEEVSQLGNEYVKVSGWIEDIREAYHQSTIFVAPLFQGAGQQNKILQAMSMGIPCITTPIVNDAIGATDGLEVLVAEDVDSFKSKINLLLKDENLRNKISLNARAFVEKQFSWEREGEQLVTILGSVT